MPPMEMAAPTSIRLVGFVSVGRTIDKLLIPTRRTDREEEAGVSYWLCHPFSDVRLLINSSVHAAPTMEMT